MKRKTRARIKLEQELLFYLQLYGELRVYGELRGRNETWKMLKVIEERIDELVEILKN